MPIITNDQILIVSLRDFANKVRFKTLFKPTTFAPPNELEGKLIFIGEFISQNSKGDMW